LLGYPCAVARFVGAASTALLALVVSGPAWGQTPLQEVTRAPRVTASSKWESKFAGSSVDLSTYVGSGSLYATGYYNPYTSLALFINPSYDLGTRYKLALRARIYAELELSTPDTPNGRRFYPYDPWFWLAADNLHTFERSKIRLGAVVRAILPVSYESRYAHTIAALGGGFNVNRKFELGHVDDEARKWAVRLTYSFAAYKDFQTSNFRGSGPGDTTGCLAPPTAGAPGVSSGGGPVSAGSDHCGGPANTNFEIVQGIITGLDHGKWRLGLMLLVVNDFKYAFPTDAFTSENAVDRGRSDLTWGIVSVGYQLRPRVAVTAGISSRQPALDLRYRYPRFPFWDFSGGASTNNYSQLFLTISGTI
jgi:hypothetical protein